jgi:predicted ATPase
MQVAKRVYSLAQEQHDPAQMIGAYRALAGTHHFLGDFASARKYARKGIQIWRSGALRSREEDLDASVVVSLCYEALSEWHFGEIASSHAAMAEATALANELNDRHALAGTLHFAAILGHLERNPPEVERLVSDLIELSTRHNFAHLLAMGAVCRGWARSASGNTAAGIALIEEGIRDYQAIGSMLFLPFFLALKAEALYLANRTVEAFEAILEADKMVERSEARWWCAELHRLRAVFLAALDAEDTQIEASLCEAIRIARGQKSVSLEKRAERTYAEYRSQKARAPGGCRFRLPIC